MSEIEELAADVQAVEERLEAHQGQTNQAEQSTEQQLKSLNAQLKALEERLHDVEDDFIAEGQKGEIGPEGKIITAKEGLTGLFEVEDTVVRVAEERQIIPNGSGQEPEMAWPQAARENTWTGVEELPVLERKAAVLKVSGGTFGAEHNVNGFEETGAQESEALIESAQAQASGSTIGNNQTHFFLIKVQGLEGSIPQAIIEPEKAGVVFWAEWLTATGAPASAIHEFKGGGAFQKFEVPREAHFATGPAEKEESSLYLAVGCASLQSFRVKVRKSDDSQRKLWLPPGFLYVINLSLEMTWGEANKNIVAMELERHNQITLVAEQEAAAAAKTSFFQLKMSAFVDSPQTVRERFDAEAALLRLRLRPGSEHPAAGGNWEKMELQIQQIGA